VSTIEELLGRKSRDSGLEIENTAVEDPPRSSIVLNEAEWTPFKTHYFTENLVALGIEPGPLDL
jgi:hypothetical protein